MSKFLFTEIQIGIFKSNLGARICRQWIKTFGVRNKQWVFPYGNGVLLNLYEIERIYFSGFSSHILANRINLDAKYNNKS